MRAPEAAFRRPAAEIHGGNDDLFHEPPAICARSFPASWPRPRPLCAPASCRAWISPTVASPLYRQPIPLCIRQVYIPHPLTFHLGCNANAVACLLRVSTYIGCKAMIYQVRY